MQTKKQSLVESITNIIIGYAVALISQLIIFPLFGIDVPLESNIKIGIFFTAVSLARSYALRRLFNRRIKYNEQKSTG